MSKHTPPIPVSIIGLCLIGVVVACVAIALSWLREKPLPAQSGTFTACDLPVAMAPIRSTVVVACHNGSTWRLDAKAGATRWLPMAPLPGSGVSR